MRKINTLLVDDEQEALDSLEILLSSNSQINIIKKITNPLDVFSNISYYEIDLIFLDINMPNVNGIELLEKIREYNTSIKIIYVTAYSNYALEAIKNNVFSYLLKPVNRVELYETLENVQKLICKNSKFESKSKTILINTKNNTFFINICDLVYLEADGNYSKLYLAKGNEIYASGNIGSIMKKIASDNFVKANRSMYINKKFMLSLDRKSKKCTLDYNNKIVELNVSLKFISSINSIFSNEF